MQFQTIDQDVVAKVLGIPPEKIEPNTMMAGDGLSRHAIVASDYVVEMTDMAKTYTTVGHNDPAKAIWNREDDVRDGYYRPMHLHRVNVGVDSNGEVVSWDHVIVG